LRKPNWACVSCGMYSSRKSSVKRHIQNIHGGNANFVSFVDYLAGRKSGLYWPALPPTYQKKNNETNNKKSTDCMSIMSEEVWRQYIKQKMGTAPNNSNLFQKFLENSGNGEFSVIKQQ
jgi:hypothetical protein